MPTHSLKAQERPLHVGDRVEMTFGSIPVEATVIEDRGDLGVGGRQIVRLTMRFEAAEEDTEFELPAEELRLVQEADAG